jgi:hypothetical protein
MAELKTPKRQRAAARLWTLVACLLALLMAGLAYCMLSPVRWDGLGKFGALALFFPLHLLTFTLVAGVLVFLAKRAGARLAVWIFGLVMIMTVAMALTPAIAVWRHARQLGVPLSLGSYLANAGHPNLGPPQRERSVVYGTATDGTKLELDVWRTGQPSSGPLRPAIVFVHGGAWTHGHRSSTPAWDRWLSELGYEVFDVEYRMPPPVRWLDEIGDVKAALGWVVAHAADYHVAIDRISVMGSSAGANLSRTSPDGAVHRRFSREISRSLSAGVSADPRQREISTDPHDSRDQRSSRLDAARTFAGRGAEKGRRAARAGGSAGQRPCLRRQLGRFRHAGRARPGQSFPSEARLSSGGRSQ